jgi:hypothetical protein
MKPHPAIRRCPRPGALFNIYYAASISALPTTRLEDGMKNYIEWLATHDEAALD